MRMRAIDSFSSYGIGMVHAGQEFEVSSEARAKEFEAKGLAKPITAKADAPHQNKAEPAPENKTEAPAKKNAPRRKAPAKKKG